MKLYKHVVTDKKVSFIEQQSYEDVRKRRQPMMVTVAKEDWVAAERPEVLTIKIIEIDERLLG